jgi:hypothetical protein
MTFEKKDPRHLQLPLQIGIALAPVVPSCDPLARVSQKKSERFPVLEHGHSNG